MMGPLVLFAAMLGLSAAADKPHVIFFLMDDMGWNDCSWHNENIKVSTLMSLLNVSMRLIFYTFPKQIRLLGPVLIPIRAVFDVDIDVKTALIGVKTGPNKRICLRKV